MAKIMSRITVLVLIVLAAEATVSVVRVLSASSNESTYTNAHYLAAENVHGH